MTISPNKNRGEWSELYVILKLLSAGEILTTYNNATSVSPAFKVLQVARTALATDHFYRVTERGVEVVNTQSKKVIETISHDWLKDKAMLLLGRMKHAAGRAFEIKEMDEVLVRLKLANVTGDASKSDLEVILYDHNVSKEVRQGFSIKSWVGGRPTLLNASGVTNLDYSISGTLTSDEMTELNKLGPIKIVSALITKGHVLQMCAMDDRFRENLKLIDSQMDELLGHAVLLSFTGKGRTISTITDLLSAENPLSYKDGTQLNRYRHKVKDLLQAVALAMRPSEPWDGVNEARGGTIIVTKDGQIICQHSLDSESLRTSLYENTYFDTPSRTKWHFGKIKTTTSGPVLTLNFQIRFKSSPGHRRQSGQNQRS